MYVRIYVKLFNIGYVYVLHAMTMNTIKALCMTYICITYIFTACDDLYTQAVQFSMKCSGQINAIQQLESRLSQQSAANGEKDIVKHSLVKLQEEMEIICLSINRRQEALQKSTSLLIS